jgi:plastocyanin
MRKLIGLLTALLVAAPVAQATASVGEGPSHEAYAESYVFAGGGTQASNGFFFPGTTVFENGEYYGVPLEVPQGSDLQFVNIDHFAVAGGGHKIVSYDRVKRGKRKVPLFASKMVDGPGRDLVEFSHVEPGTYRYYCPIHNGMLGTIVVK